MFLYDISFPPHLAISWGLQLCQLHVMFSKSNLTNMQSSTTPYAGCWWDYKKGYLYLFGSQLLRRLICSSYWLNCILWGKSGGRGLGKMSEKQQLEGGGGRVWSLEKELWEKMQETPFWRPLRSCQVLWPSPWASNTAFLLVTSRGTGRSKMKEEGLASLLVQWLRLWNPNAGGQSSIPGQGTRFVCVATKITDPTWKWVFVSQSCPSLWPNGL